MKSLQELEQDFDFLVNITPELLPETRALLIAIFYRAFKDLLGTNIGEYEKQTARNWVFGSEQKQDPYAFSFVEVCDYLKLDPELIRNKIFSKMCEDEQ